MHTFIDETAIIHVHVWHPAAELFTEIANEIEEVLVTSLKLGLKMKQTAFAVSLLRKIFRSRKYSFK